MICAGINSKKAGNLSNFGNFRATRSKNPVQLTELVTFYATCVAVTPGQFSANDGKICCILQPASTWEGIVLVAQELFIPSYRWPFL